MEDLDFEVKSDSSAVGSSDLLFQSFTLVCTIVAAEEFPNLKSADIRYHHESSPEHGAWTYFVIPSLEFSKPVSGQDMKNISNRIKLFLSPLLERVTEEILRTDGGSENK